MMRSIVAQAHVHAPGEDFDGSIIWVRIYTGPAAFSVGLTLVWAQVMASALTFAAIAKAGIKNRT
jgi:hypothetical protein